ncbi:MAG TPA: hypothetical protein VGP72_10045 [Planctomycetota bacterium]
MTHANRTGRIICGLATLLVLLVSGPVQASGSGKKTGTGTDGTLYVQTTYLDANSVNLGFNGTPCYLEGRDINVAPTGPGDFNYVTAQPSPGTVLTPMTIGANNYLVEQAPDLSGNMVSTGKAFWVDPSVNGAGQPNTVRIVPGAAFETLSVGQINGTSSTAATGIDVGGIHSDASQLFAGLSNIEINRTTALDGLIAAVKAAATGTINLATGATSGSMGTIASPALVYAGGVKNADGTVTENTGIHWSGNQTGAGILVMEIDDPNNVQFEMSGQSRWTGLIIIACNKNPSSNKEVLTFVGGGGTQSRPHIVGGAFFYMRNMRRNATDTTSPLGQTLVKLAGNGDINFCDGAIDAAFKCKPSAMQVRSWRKLQENE